MVKYLTRYGYQSEVTEDNLEKIMNDLLKELKTEEYGFPDDEHTEVSISNENLVAAVMVDGLVVLEKSYFNDDELKVDHRLYMQNIPDKMLFNILFLKEPICQ